MDTLTAQIFISCKFCIFLDIYYMRLHSNFIGYYCSALWQPQQSVSASHGRGGEKSSVGNLIFGISSYSKKVILFGSDGNVKVFSSRDREDGDCDTSSRRSTNMPKCVVQAVDPIPLSARICEIHDCYENVRCIPKCICDCIGGNVVTDLQNGTPTVYVTLGLFTIVQLIRNVQMLIPVYDFCIPEKQCDDSTDQPCDTFRKIKFPTDDFFPPRPCEFRAVLKRI